MCRRCSTQFALPRLVEVHWHLVVEPDGGDAPRGQVPWITAHGVRGAASALEVSQAMQCLCVAVRL